MDIKLEIYGNEMQAAQLELLIKILAHQKATISLLCDKLSKSEQEADELISLVNDECVQMAETIRLSLYERRGHINPDDILPNK